MLFILPNADNVFSQDIDNSKFFYVATNGNDQWSGMLSAPDSSGNDGPFATLQRARNAIRKLRRDGSNYAFTVFVRGGIYQLNKTFTLGPEDSGTESHPTIFKAFSNECPILVGTKKITNFEVYKENIYKAKIADKLIEVNSVRQLFANGKRQILSRYPNFDPMNPIGGGFLYVASSVEKESRRKFKYKRGDIHDWSNIFGAEVFIFPGSNWGGRAQALLSIDRKNQLITLAEDAWNNIKAGNRFFFQNLKEELDSPGEWYFDRHGKTIYFWPVNDADLRKTTIPVLKSILEIKRKKFKGKGYGTPSYIKFEGFTFNGCAGNAVVVSEAKHLIFARNTIFNAGGNGIEIRNGSENTVVGNDIYDIGGTGILISAGNRQTLVPANNRVDNNHIYNTGVFEKGGASGILCKGVGNVVSHNLIHSMPRIGVWIDGNDNLIEYNHIHHVNLETQDSGAVYFGQVDWTKRGNVVQFNYIHDSGGYGRSSIADVWQSPFGTYGIYMDDWTSGSMIYGNIVANTANAGIFIHGGRDNIVENNVIIEGGKLGQMIYSGWPLTHPVAQKLLPKMFEKIKAMGYTKYPQLSTITDVETGSKMSGNIFVRNIVYYENKNAPLYGVYNHIDLATTVSDFNTIYHAGQSSQEPYIKMGTADLQWEIWKNNGLDQNSIIADPLIDLSPAGKFQLSSTSPALKMGFKPIPFEKIGLYKDPNRASWSE